MANLPLLLSLANDLSRLSLNSSPFYESPSYYVRHPGYLALVNAGDQTQPLRLRDKQTSGPISTIGKDGFQVCMEVQQFKPSELSVKVVDNCVIVEGKHEEREDDQGYIARHFVRRYALPKGYDPNKVVSTLSSDGVLTVTVPKPQIEENSNERQIQIQQVGPAHLNVKENVNEDKEKEDGDTDKAQAKL
ncbi:heat shock protein 23-like [Calliphora vicina]|uniref:heat shock protein 23-like n=1 Tax=Calliphora vicina TaxID=7373 RepID=UPI00325B7CAC